MFVFVSLPKSVEAYTINYQLSTIMVQYTPHSNTLNVLVPCLQQYPLLLRQTVTLYMLTIVCQCLIQTENNKCALFVFVPMPKSVEACIATENKNDALFAKIGKLSTE